MFRVAEHEYDITSANIEIFANDAEQLIGWGVKIIGKSQGAADDIAMWNPAIIAEALLETKPGQVSHWHEIAGRTIAWDEPDEDPQALFEVFETEAIYKCQWQFLKGQDGGGVRLLLEGMVDVDVDHEGLPIYVDTKLGIAPWPMRFRSEQECLDRYKQFGFKDPVKFEVINRISSLVFLNQ